VVKAACKKAAMGVANLQALVSIKDLPKDREEVSALIIAVIP